MFTPGLLCSLLLLGEEPSDEFGSLITKHEQYLQRIETMSIEVEAKLSQDGGQTWKPMAKVIWHKDGARHKFRKAIYAYMSAGSNTYTFDTLSYEFYCDATESRELLFKGTELPAEPGFGRTRAVIGDPPQWLSNHLAPLWLFYYADPSGTLPDVYRRSANKKFLGKVNIDGRELLGMELENPDIPNIVSTLYLDGAKNYAIVRRESRLAPSQERAIARGLEWKEVKAGIHIPMHVQDAGVSSGQPTIVDVRVLSVAINEPQSPDVFEVRFPRGEIVRNVKSGERYIWGENEPARTFRTDAEFVEWLEKQQRRAPGRVTIEFMLINLAGFTLIIVLVVLRRRYMSKALPVGSS